MHFPTIQILLSFEYAAKSQSGKPLAIEQDVEDTKDFQNGAFVADKNLL